jgi:hypothetical protein
MNRGNDNLSYTGIAWEMGQQFIPPLCSWQNGLSLSIEAQNLGGSTKSAEQKRNTPVFSEMSRVYWYQKTGQVDEREEQEGDKHSQGGSPWPVHPRSTAVISK